MEMIGRLGSTEAMAWRICPEDTLAPGRVTIRISCRKCEPGLLSFPVGNTSCCASGTKKNGPIGWSRSKSRYRASWATPTISYWRDVPIPVCPKYFSIGSSFWKNLRANAWLITATCCEVAVSRSEIPRPSIMGVPTAVKYPAVTRSQEVETSSFGPGAGRPSTHTPAPQLLRLSGEYFFLVMWETPRTLDNEFWIRP